MSGIGRVFVCALVCALTAASCASNKAPAVKTESADAQWAAHSRAAETGLPVVVRGIVQKSGADSFSLVSGKNSKNRVTYRLEALEGHEEVYRQLGASEGKLVTVSALVLERKSRWFMTLGVLSARAGAE